jgi:hypothetical protein
MRLPKEWPYHLIPITLFILAWSMALNDKDGPFITFTILGTFFGISAHASKTVTYDGTKE